MRLTYRTLKYSVIITVLGMGLWFLFTTVGITGFGGNSTDGTLFGDGINETEVEQNFLVLLNEERRERGLEPVSQRNVLTEMAMWKARDMAEHNRFNHTDSQGRTIRERYADRGLLPECRLPTEDGRYYPGAENIMQFRGDYSREEGTIARQVFKAWMESRGHREAMLVTSADEAGLGVASGADKLWVALELC